MATPKSELLPVLPMDDVVVLPHMSVTLAVEGDDQKAAIEAARQGNRLVLLVPRIDGKFGAIGTAARLGESAELPTGAEAFMIRGEYRARLGSGQADIGGALWVKADPIDDPEPPTEKSVELAREYRALLENLVESRGVPQVVQFLRAARTPGHLADLAGYSPDLTTEQKLEIPWNVRSEDNYDLKKARQILDEDHTGLGDVKDRIIEFLAVRKLRTERGLEVLSGRGSGAIITLVGPPGVGKTSLGESVARALGRKFTRVSLGGIRDEADIRGHRRRRQITQAGLKTEEVTVDDAAIMKVITDHTREAGVRNLERELGKITRKVATKVATGQLTPPVAITPDRVREFLGKPKFDNEVAARTAVPGVATGLAVTGTGGDVLFVEATATDANGNGGGGLLLTGQLGDVMKESAQIALSYVRSHAEELNIGHDQINKSFHIHVPEGAVPKDGPSAGVTMTTAIVSLLTGRPVRNTVGMTGEVTLQGLVLPIGGVKQKVLAAHRMGLKEVILPRRNEKDIDDVPKSVREAMTFHLASRVDDVLKHALEPASTTKSKTEAA